MPCSGADSTDNLSYGSHSNELENCLTIDMPHLYPHKPLCYGNNIEQITSTVNNFYHQRDFSQEEPMLPSVNIFII